MPYFLAPDPAQSTFLIPGTNTPGDGVQLFTYEAGTTTKITVYKDNAGSASHTNPIVLDSGGNLPSASVIWLASGNTYKFVWAPANDTDPPASPYRTIDNVSGINDVGVAESLQWIAGPTPTFVGATALTLIGDQTGDAQVGRRIQTANTGGTIYSTITSSAFGGSTTAVGVTNDSGSLDSGLSSLNYGLLTKINPSVPLLSDFYQIRSSSTDATKTLRVEVGPIASSTNAVMTIPQYSFRPATQNRGTNVSTQSTTNVSTATGDLIDIYGTTAVDQLTMYDGQIITMRFTEATPLNNSTTFVLLGGRNMTTVAGDFATFRGYAPPLVRMESYASATQQMLPLTLISTASFPAAASTAVTDIPQTYSALLIEIQGQSMSTPATTPLIQVSTTNGISWDNTAANYQGFHISGGTAGQNDLPTLSRLATQAAAEVANYVVSITGYQAGVQALAHAAGNSQSAASTFASIITHNATSAINAIRFGHNNTSGTIDAGTYTIWGVR